MNKLIKSSLGLPLGLVSGFLAAFLHQATFNLFITVYWGLVFVWIFLIYLMRWSINFSKTKLAAVFFIPGWFLTTYLLSTLTNAGDIVIANETISKIYLATAVIFLGIAAVLPVKN